MPSAQTEMNHKLNERPKQANAFFELQTAINITF